MLVIRKETIGCKIEFLTRHSMTLQQTAVRLIGLYFRTSALVPFLKTGVSFASFQSDSLPSNNSWKIYVSGLASSLHKVITFLVEYSLG